MSTESNTTIPDEYLPLLEVGQVITNPIVIVLVMCIVYGFYVLLFGLCIYVLRRSGLHRKLYIFWTSALFVLSTFMVIVETTLLLVISTAAYLFVKDRVPRTEKGHDKLKFALNMLRPTLFILANIVADSMLIHRCYVIWGSRKRVAVPVVVISCLTNAISVTGLAIFFKGHRDLENPTREADLGNTILASGIVVSASFNLALTLLTAGRIWWITRHLNPSKTRVLKTINKITLESGIIYPLVTILHLALVNSHPNDGPFDMLPLVVLAAGIAPTLIMVLTRLAIHVVEDLHAAHAPNNKLTSCRMTERSFALSRVLEEPQVPRELEDKALARGDSDLLGREIV